MKSFWDDPTYQILHFTIGLRIRSYLNELRSGEFEEGGLGLRGARPRHEGLPGAWRPVQQHPLRRLDADVHKLLLLI